MMRLVLGALAIAVGMIVASCSSSSSTPAGPSQVVGPLTGMWTGTVSRPGLSQAVRLTLAETQFGGIIVSGTYVLGEGASASSGTIGGAFASARDVLLTMSPAVPVSCPQPQVFPAGHIALDLALDGSWMSGPATFTLCGGEARGSATFAR